MTTPAMPELVRVVISNLYTETDLVFVGQAHEVLAHLLEVFAWLRPSSPSLRALEQLVEISDREQCFSAEIDIVSAKRSSP
jgi:hypothetical protein